MKAFIFCLLLFSFPLFSQGLKVEYEYVNKQNLFENSTLSEESIKKGKELSNNPQKYVLMYFDGNTFFKNINSSDSFTKETSRTTEQEGNTKLEKVQAERLIKKDTKIFHNKNEKGFYQYFNFNKEELYHYSEPEVESINYKNETSYIDIYKCNLVEIIYKNGTNAKVWYTEDIPINGGPFAFNNLPGLILKVETPNFLIFATKVSDFKNQNEMEIVNKKLTVFNDDDFRRKMIELRNQPVIETRNEVRK